MNRPPVGRPYLAESTVELRVAIPGSAPALGPPSPAPVWGGEALARPDLMVWEASTWPRWRHEAVLRVRQATARHARHAWQRRHKDPLCPHALILLYAPMAPDPAAVWELRTAGRILLHGDEPDLPALLRNLTGIAAAPGGGLDPRRDLCTWAQPMPTNVGLLGLAVSTLDTPAGSWAQVQRAARWEIDIPGRGYLLLVDGTRILADRVPGDALHPATFSTATVDDGLGPWLRRWRWGHHLHSPTGADTGIWYGLDMLLQTIAPPPVPKPRGA